jgi:hypothetical protein
LTGVLSIFDRARKHWTIIAARADNACFQQQHPDFIPPPPAAMYDAYGSASFRAYWGVGQYGASRCRPYPQASARSRARLRVGLWSRPHSQASAAVFAERAALWHRLQQESIAWCRTAIENVTFAVNEFSPPLPFGERQFDAIYAISVLTHLSVEQQDSWIKELRRVAAINGCLILTTNGTRSAATMLLPEEQDRFQKEGVVIRGRVEEGKRCFLSYHHPSYAREHLFSGLRICEHIPGIKGAPATEQDIWVLRIL